MTAKRSAAVLAVVLILAVSFCSYKVREIFDDRICGGVWLEEIYLGGLTRQEAQKAIEKWQQTKPENVLTLKDGNTFFYLHPEKDINFSIDAPKLAEIAFNIGREGGFWQRIAQIYQTKKDGYAIALKIKYDETRLEKILQNLQNQKEIAPQNVSVGLLSQKVIPEKWGQKLDIDLLRAEIIKYLYSLAEVTFEMPIVPVAPRLTAADLDKNGLRELMSVYATTFNSGDSNRTSNIRLAAKKINGWLLFPGEVFSFNQIVGPRSKEDGFKEAMEIVHGEFVPGIGGGVCQVSSTLYNAVLLAGLNIVERTNHSRPLRYVPPGRDATVAYGSIDFKFKNNNLLPVMVLAEVAGNRLHVGILGTQNFKEHSPKVSFAIITTGEKPIKPQNISEIGDNYGFEVGAYRITLDEQGQEIQRETLSFDRYLPDAEITVDGQAQE